MIGAGALGVALVVWLVMPQSGAPDVRGMAFPSLSAHANSASHRTNVRETNAKPRIPRADALELAHLLTETAAKMREFDRLRALPDDIGNFRKSAEIENEYRASLDPETAALLLCHMPLEFRDTYFGQIALGIWAHADRGAAAEWMAAHPSSSQATAAALAGGWFTDDPGGLRDYLDELPPGAWKNSLATTASEDAFVAKDPQQSIELLDQAQGFDAHRSELYGWAVTAWAKDDFASAVKWATSITDPAMRQRMLASAAVGQANVDPATAAGWAIANVSDPQALEPAVTSIIRLWAQKDATAAAGWVAQFPPGTVRDNALDGLMAIWAPGDPQGAGAWQATLVDPKLRDQARQAFEKARAHIGPVAAMEKYKPAGAPDN